MKFDVYTGIIDQFTGLRDLHLQGLGEPMMHPRFFEMVSYAVSKGIRVTTNSNATFLNYSRARTMQLAVDWRIYQLSGLCHAVLYDRDTRQDDAGRHQQGEC